MQVKYIVHEQDRHSVVDIWATDGAITHPFYEKTHQIKKSSISSEGYVFFLPKDNCWKLEHFPMYNKYQADTVAEFLRRLWIEKRDRLLIYRALYHHKELENVELKLSTYQEYQQVQKIKQQQYKQSLSRI